MLRLLPSSCWLFLLLAAAPITAADREPPPKTRTFEFTYAATVTGLKPDQTARIWLPIPPDNDEQKIEIVTPLKDAKVTTEKFYGNKVYYLEAKADADGKIPLKMAFKVTRLELRSLSSKDVKDDADRLARYLQPDKLVPLEGKPLELIKDKELPKDEMAKAKLLYDIVNKHMKYNKDGTGWGRGDAVWACENGRGNCTDFHSLFISLARAQKIPAKFEIGFGLPPKRGEDNVAGSPWTSRRRTRTRRWPTTTSVI